ncbi:hypothetical protein RE432_14900 [Pusillimonas sp. SM2304]|uniref:hypothetical protein n=1 Tax=Pusillimonas sp. SM2304 TaxID=3073241 RepID=UPI00287678A9|nr:hypothetical protein [Pusillimonas sp. SM2304]MDS1141727.1 hypothetical protein [Pusillimonas sp. SM2304]
MSEPLFKTAHQALTFAYNFSDSSLDRPLMNRLADKFKPTGKGLAGLDGAAQAGMILRNLKALPRLYQMILVARFAPQGSECHCCGGPVPSLIWLGAIREISDAAVTQALSGHVTMRALRDGLVARYFGQKLHLQALAKKANVNRDTASKQNGQIVIWLHGTRITKKGELRENGIKGQEQLALDAAEAALLVAGIVDSA